jgi:transcriptional regulator with XRE-family HTH domain
MTEQTLPNVGLRIRALRERQGLSLRALSERCGLSINAISRIERGENSPTVASLHQLATALKVPITNFFAEEIHQVTVFIRRNRRPSSSANGVLLESLGTGLPDQHLEPFLLTLEPGAENTADPVAHLGEEFVHCLEGQVEYLVGDQVYWLEAGDSLLFQAEQGHKCTNTTQAPAVILLVFETADGLLLGWDHHLD